LRITILSHHLFNKQDIDWLKGFKEHHLADDEARILIILREMGVMTNADYRMPYSSIK